MILQQRKDLIRRAIDTFKHLETCPKRDYTFMTNEKTQRCGVGCLSCYRVVELPAEESPMKWSEAFHEVKIDNEGGGNILDELQ
jgi:hypothetical protein